MLTLSSFKFEKHKSFIVYFICKSTNNALRMMTNILIHLICFSAYIALFTNLITANLVVVPQKAGEIKPKVVALFLELGRNL